MATLEKINIEGTVLGTVEVSSEIAEANCSDALVHQCVVAERARQRAGTAHTKTKGEIRCTTKKPWRQKGTGRARAGHRGSTIWRGGGVVFGPRYRKYNKKVSRKTKRLVLKAIIGDIVRDERAQILDSWSLDAPKTTKLVKLKNNLECRKMLCIGCGDTHNAQLSARNISDVNFIDVSEVTIYTLLRYDGIVISEEAWNALITRAQSTESAKETG
jgi:large subunit ribosomal protein L4